MNSAVVQRTVAHVPLGTAGQKHSPFGFSQYSPSQTLGCLSSLKSTFSSSSQICRALDIEVREPLVRKIQPQPHHPEPKIPKEPETLVELWKKLKEDYRDCVAVIDDNHAQKVSMTYGDAYDEINDMAAGLQALGLQPNEKVSLFSESSARWLVADQAVMFCGGADAVRGVHADSQELAYILEKSESQGLIVQDAKVLGNVISVIGDKVHQLKFVIVLHGNATVTRPDAVPFKALKYDEVLSIGSVIRHQGKYQPPQIKCQDIATLVFTSGTTGHPKGAALTHGNLMYQMNRIAPRLNISAGQKLLSFLPIWHVYERTCNYVCLGRGMTIVISSKKTLVNDLKKHRPHFVTCVPQVLDFMYKKVINSIQKSSAVRQALAMFLLKVSSIYIQHQRVVLGVCVRQAVNPFNPLVLFFAHVVSALLRPLHALSDAIVGSKVRAQIGLHPQGCMVSGGGSLSPYLDDFFESVGINVLNGWGLTETSPVLSFRGPQTTANPRGSAGHVLDDTQLVVVDPENPDPRRPLPDGVKGLILAQGPGIMSGYYNDEDATSKAFFPLSSEKKLFNTGDIGYRIPEDSWQNGAAGAVVLAGRQKDTIVLFNGENVEPSPIEDAIKGSPFVHQVLLVGQDQKHLGALISCNEEALADYASKQGRESLSEQEVQELLRQEIASRTQGLGLQPYEKVTKFAVIDRPFSVEDGTLTLTLKPRRRQIDEAYKRDIDMIFGNH